MAVEAAAQTMLSARDRPRVFTGCLRLTLQSMTGVDPALAFQNRPSTSCSNGGACFNVMNGLPITAAVSEVLSLLQLRLHQGTADTGVAVSVHPVGEPRARDADLGGVAALDHAVVSVAPFLHCQHRFPVSTYVLARGRCEAVGRLSVIPVLLTEVAVCGTCLLSPRLGS